MGKAPILLVDTYDQDDKLIDSNRPSFLRKKENERVEKLKKSEAAAKAKKEAAKSETKSNKAEEKAANTETETTQPKDNKKEGELLKETIPAANPEVK